MCFIFNTGTLVQILSTNFFSHCTADLFVKMKTSYTRKPLILRNLSEISAKPGRIRPPRFPRKRKVLPRIFRQAWNTQASSTLSFRKRSFGNFSQASFFLPVLQPFRAARGWELDPRLAMKITCASYLTPGRWYKYSAQTFSVTAQQTCLSK